MRQAFINDNCNSLGAMNLCSENLEQNWTVFQNVVHSSAVTTLGHSSRKHQAWFGENEEEIKRRFEEKHRLHKAHQDDTSLGCMKAAYINILQDIPEQAQAHARLLAEQESILQTERTKRSSMMQ